MSKTSDGDISNAELLEAINAAFDSMQQQIDKRFDGNAAEHGGMQQQINNVREENAAEHAKTRDELTEFREENAAEHASINQKLDNTITRVDTYDRRLEKLEAKIA